MMGRQHVIIITLDELKLMLIRLNRDVAAWAPQDVLRAGGAKEITFVPTTDETYSRSWLITKKTVDDELLSGNRHLPFG